MTRNDISGNIVSSATMEDIGITTNSLSECWNIVLMPTIPYIAFAGTMINNLGIYKANAMVTKSKDDFTNALTVVWSTAAASTVNQYGRDLAVTSDGSIYVTGYLDCQRDAYSGQATYSY